jgi:hypothetical protein
MPAIHRVSTQACNNVVAVLCGTYQLVYPHVLSTTVGIVGMKGTGVNIGKYCGLMPQGVTLVVVET